MAELLAPGRDLDKLRIEESEGILANIAQQRVRLLQVQDRAMAKRQDFGVIRAAQVIQNNIELTGKYLGKFAKHSTQMNVLLLITPQYLELRAALVAALKPFPDARQAVAAVISRIERAAAGGGLTIEGEPYVAAEERWRWAPRPARERPVVA